MNYPNRLFLIVDDGQHGDLKLLHDGERIES